MKLTQTLLARLFSRKGKAKGPDAFDLRLQRTLRRERLHRVRPLLFRSPLQLTEA